MKEHSFHPARQAPHSQMACSRYKTNTIQPHSPSVATAAPLLYFVAAKSRALLAEASKLAIFNSSVGDSRRLGLQSARATGGLLGPHLGTATGLGLRMPFWMSVAAMSA